LILYTPFPLELIFAAEDNAISPYQEIEINGATLVVQSTGIGIGKIVQVRSTDPNIYLKPDFQPGQFFSFFQS
jgi:hypothetical protein